MEQCTGRCASGGGQSWDHLQLAQPFQPTQHRSTHPLPPSLPGTITAEELREALKQKGSLMKAEELEGLLKLIDQDESGCIDYEVGVGWGAAGQWAWVGC